jgi:hypothetical protein
MAREILKAYYNTYNEVEDILQQIDYSWNDLKSWDRFKFAKHPFKIYYINPTTKSIDDVFGPYKMFDLEGNTLQVERTNKEFELSNEVFKYAPIITYLKLEDTNELYMLFISKEGITDEFIEEEIRVINSSKSTISINNTTNLPVYYSLTSNPVAGLNLVEVKAGLIEVIQPTASNYLYLTTGTTPIIINTANTRTKLVNDYFLLVCPANVSNIKVAKLTGNPLSTIDDNLELFITI